MQLFFLSADNYFTTPLNFTTNNSPGISPIFAADKSITQSLPFCLQEKVLLLPSTVAFVFEEIFKSYMRTCGEYVGTIQYKSFPFLVKKYSMSAESFFGLINCATS